MSNVETGAISVSAHGRVGHVGVVITALGLAAVFAVQMLSIGTTVQDAMSTDDIMRLVEVRQFIDGQNWFDLWQHRLNPPGVLMHWSRIVDLPLAGIYLGLKPLLGAARAETWMLFLWPLMLFALMLVLVVAIARQLSGGMMHVQAAAVILALLAKPALGHFRPGAIDHHDLQICLVLALLLFVLQQERRPGRAVPAALMASLSLAVGLETLPAVAAISAAVAGLFIWKGAAVARPVAIYALTLALSSLALAAGFLPASAIAAPVCDALGGPVLVLTVGGGVGLAFMVEIDRYWAGLWTRFVTAAVVCVLVVAGLGSFYGQCLAGPYAAIDPLVASLWLDKVQETVSFWKMFRLGPEEVLAFYAFPLITIGVAIGALLRSPPPDRFRWGLCVVILATQFIISLWEMRGAAAASVLAAPIFAAAVVNLWPAFATAGNLSIAALAVSPVMFAIVGAAARPLTDAVFKPDVTEIVPEARQCMRFSDVAPLAHLAKGRVMAPIDLGPAILAQTSHDVFAAPFHRNVAGNRAMFKLMLASPPAARQMLSDLHVDYVVTCRTAPNMDIVRLAPDGLEARLARGETPTFLTPIEPGATGRISVWRVTQ